MPLPAPLGQDPALTSTSPSPQPTSAAQLSAYTERDVLSTVQRILTTMGLTAPLDPAALPVDQYHSGGHQAVHRLLSGMPIARGSHVLDVGSGLGGPARMIAALTGAHVHGVDITAEYVTAATWLTEQAHLNEQVSFTHTPIEQLTTDRLYDAAITMHVQMNIPDKTAWYRAIGHHLRPGATLGIWEIAALTDDDLTWPMPWSITGTDSHLWRPGDLHTAITDAGYTTNKWIDDAAWLKDWFTATLAAGAGANPGLSVIDNGPACAANFARAVLASQVTVIRATFTKTGPAPAA